MKLTNLSVVALMVGALSIVGCDDEQATGGTSGTGASGGSEVSGGADGGGGSGGGGGAGGAVDPDLCSLGLCTDDETLSAACLDEYDACVGRGHYPWACRLDADETCGI